MTALLRAPPACCQGADELLPLPTYRRGRDRVYLTTGQIAHACGCAPRTVSKWFDAGLLRGHRLEGSADRRVHWRDLQAFLAARGMEAALDRMLGPRAVLLCAVPAPLAEALAGLLEGTRHVRAAADAFELGQQCERLRAARAVVVDAVLGRAEALAIAGRLAALDPAPLTVLLWPEDQAPPAEADQGGVVYLRQPVAAAKLARLLG